jgi:hypothetical protein
MVYCCYLMTESNEFLETEEESRWTKRSLAQL